MTYPPSGSASCTLQPFFFIQRSYSMPSLAPLLPPCLCSCRCRPVPPIVDSRHTACRVARLTAQYQAGNVISMISWLQSSVNSKPSKQP